MAVHVTRNAGVGFDSSVCHTESAFGEEGNGKPPHKIKFPRKRLRALSLASAMLKIEYAM